jgi:hypothetical protein
MTQTEQQEYLDQCEAAFLVFADRFPDFDQSEATSRIMAAGLREVGLSPTSSDHLAAVWLKIRPSVPAPAPVVTESTDPIEREALRMIADGEVTVASVRAMSSHELELRIRNLAFCRALELLPKPAPEPIRTRGDYVREHGIADHANKEGIVLDYDPVAAVEATRRAFAEGYANSSSAPAAPARGASRSVVNLNQAMHIPKAQPSLQACLTQEQKDQKWLEEQRTKSARAIRVRANRGKA